MKKPRLLLADDHTILVEGLKALLAPEFEVVATAGDGRAVLEAAEKHRPDLILLDISMPGLNGIEAARRLKRIESRRESDYPHHAWGPQFCERGVRGGGFRIRVETVGGDRTGHGAP
jgi:CheY-like chemotaxis protein